MDWEILLTCIFIGSGIALIHTYFLYPITLHFLTWLNSGPTIKQTDKLPTVALIIAAYNEEEVIEKKIQNSLHLKYPDDLLNIIVFSDASDDNTDEIVKRYKDKGVSLIRIEGRVGKTECQNRVVDIVDEDILVFSDANSMYDPDAISELVSGFGPNVGCVVGELRYRESGEVRGESVYWRYESWIKRLESQFYSLVTGNGSIYAVRSKSYVPQPPDTISDFTEPLSIVQNGERVGYRPHAVAWEETENSSSKELQRRIRIVTRSWNSIIRFKDLLTPFQTPRFAYQLWSHKILRWLSPIFIISILLANMTITFIIGSTIYEITLIGQLLFYSLAAVGWIADKLDIDDPTVTHVPFYFLQANYGLLQGLLNFLRGKTIIVWETSTRSNE